MNIWAEDEQEMNKSWTGNIPQEKYMGWTGNELEINNS